MNKFSFDTIEDFDRHISSSILGYDVLNSLLVNISSFFVSKGDCVYDIGCTSGRLISNVSKKYGIQGIGVDVTNHNFLPESKADSNTKLLVQDITSEGFEFKGNPGIVFSIFTLQFLPQDSRKGLLKKVFNALAPGGVLIVAEKEISKDGIIQECFTFSNYDYKKNQFTEQQILSKEQDLRQLMDCLPEGGNIDLFKSAGFEHISQFFQSLNFKGWICRK